MPGVHVGEHGRRIEGARARRAPRRRAAARAPFATLALRPARAARRAGRARASGPTPIASSQRVAHAPRRMRSTSRSSNAPRTGSTTMKRLAAMQLCPPLMSRARDADLGGGARGRRPRARRRGRCRRARARSSSARAPAVAATARPRRRAAGERHRRDLAARSISAATRVDADQRACGTRLRAGPARAKQLLDRERAARHVRRVLQQPAVAGHQRRRREAEDLPEREVPRHHREHDAERLEGDEALRGLGRDRLAATSSARRAPRSSRRRTRTSRPRPGPGRAACPSRRPSAARARRASSRRSAAARRITEARASKLVRRQESNAATPAASAACTSVSVASGYSRTREPVRGSMDWSDIRRSACLRSELSTRLEGSSDQRREFVDFLLVAA